MASLVLVLMFVPLLPDAHAARLSGHIPEDAPRGTAVRGLLLPRCARAGGSDTGPVTLRGEHSTDFELVPRAHGARLGLVSTRALDREFIAMYYLHAHLPARCLPRRVHVQVEVSDVNDNTPYFTTGNRSVELDALAPRGTELTRFDARDADAERNGRVLFFLCPGVPQLHVVPGSGQVLLVDSVHGLQRVTARLCVRDEADVPRTGEPVFLHVHVRSGAEHARRRRSLLEELTYTVRVPEKVRVGQLLFTLPEPRFQQRRVELLSAATVTVERDTGRMYLARVLSRDEEVTVRVHNLRGLEWYMVRICLVPSGPAPLHWTMFPFPYLSVVSPDARAGTEVYRLSVRDQDQDPGRDQHVPQVHFSLLQGGDGCLEVERLSGLVKTTGAPLSPGLEYELKVQAEEAERGEVISASVWILAGLRAPQFTNQSYVLRVEENTAPTHTVALLEAVSFQRRPLTYVLLLNPGNLFSVNQESGALSLTRSVDYESGHHIHALQVRVTEEHTRLSTVTEVVVHITDVNDCTPEFVQSIFTRDNVPETLSPGTSILQVLARDCDSGLNSDLSYSVLSEDFSVSALGVLSPARRLDFERPNHGYEFMVIAEDSGSPPRTGSASIRIRLHNSNDETPVFSQDIYRTFLSEDAGSDTLVAIVHAHDPDGDGVTYAITGGNEERNFLLDKNRGVITLRRSPAPALSGSEYILNVTATDDNASGGPHPLSSSAQVLVGINDINNNKPVFTECPQYSTRAYVLENQPASVSVLQVQAQDADLGLNGDVRYGLMHRHGQDPGFSIDAITGVITTTKTFDRERERELSVSVTATDRGEEPLMGICLVTVTVRDQNDNTPRFENSRYQHFLREDTPVGTSFLRAAAHDDDQGSHAAITYSLTNHNPPYLGVNPTTGWIYVQQPISQTSRITQQVVATDGGNRSSSVELSVTITNLHNQPPLWERSQYYTTIPENTARDHKILTIRATSPLGDPRVTYNLEEGLVPETNLPVHFYLKPNRSDGSASVLVAENLDYETTSFYTLRVRVQNVAAVPLASFTTIYVNITDVNDNVPFFQSSTYEATVPEGAEGGTTVVQVTATDLDSGPHGVVRYSLLGDDSGDSQFFWIDPVAGSILTRASFDREQKSSYLLEVQSQDGTESARLGQQGLPNTDTAYVRVFVADVNDNAPQFEKPVYEVSVEEDQEVGFSLITVTATDQDDGANAKLRYQLSSGTSLARDPALGWFGVDPQVGRVFVAQNLDFETQQRLELRLVASDGKWANDTLLVITIINRNDEAPVFSQALYQASVLEESATLPLLLLQVSAVDPDLNSDQSQLRYSLHSQGSGGEFSINAHTGSIHALRRLDREQRPVWRFLVLATDEGGAGLTGFADVVLEVKDVNDNAPFFPCGALEEDGCFVGQVAENSPADTSVMEMRATDLDDPNEGSNAAIRYSILHNVHHHLNLHLFAINASTGVISTVLRSLDREQQQRLLVVVEAQDGGGLRGTATATILVTDVNDHAPVFTQDSYSAQVWEDLELNSEVLVVSATDADAGPNAAVTFSVVDGDPERRFFMETNRTSRRGVLKLRKAVDYEREQDRSFNLTLKAEDPDLYSLTFASIQVRDANDNAPLFLPQFYEASPMYEDSPLGSIVAQVTASDLDSGQNGRFSFYIAAESDPYAQFSVDESGRVVLASLLDRERVCQHRIVVLAKDMGEPALTGSAIVMLTVLDVNDNAPEFEADYGPIVWENTGAPQVVRMNSSSVLLHVQDRDVGKNGGPFRLRMLRLTADADSFNLTDLRNGSAVLTALRMFDRERQSEYKLALVMEDSGVPSLSATHTLTVTVGDRNDNPHQPALTSFMVYSYDGLLPNTVLGKVQAPDPDDWGHKHYSLQGTPARMFSLNQSSGVLSISEATPPGSYLLHVGVSDGTWPDVSCSVRVDVRELPPEALSSAAAIRILNVTQEQLFSPVLDQSLFSRVSVVVCDLLQLPPHHVHVFSLTQASVSGHSAVDLWLSVRGEAYFRPEKILGYISAHQARLESSLGVSLSAVDACSPSPCSSSTSCSTEVDFSLQPEPLGSGPVVLVSLKPSVKARCGCRSRELVYSSCSSLHSNPCLNGGTCSDGPLGFRCVCPPLLDGPRCEQTSMTFGGSGFSWLPPLSLCASSLLSLEFVLESSGLLLYQGPLTAAQGPLTAVQEQGQAFIALELIDGVAVLSLDLGSGPLTLALPSESAVTDRHWHRLEVLIQEQSVELILDQCRPGDLSCRVQGLLPPGQRRLDVWHPLQVGGVKHFSPLLKYRRFSGCLRNLGLDSQVYDLASPGDSVDASPGCKLTDGVCVSPGGPTCGPHASCVSQWGSFSCHCHPGFRGHQCETEAPEFSLDGDSVVRLQPRAGADPRKTSVQLLLRTREKEGGLLTVEEAETGLYLCVELRGGLLSVRSDLGGGAESLLLPGLRVDLGEWIQVNLLRYDTHLTLSLEGGGGSREVQKRLPEGGRGGGRGGGHGGGHGGGRGGVEMNQVTVTVGRPDNSSKGFQGCLKDVRFNGLLLPLGGRGSEGVSVLQERGVSSGCSSDACASAPCPRPLRCVDQWRRHQCRCPGSQMLLSDSGGERCVPSPCRAWSCGQGGVCQPLSAEHFLCVCGGGLRGHRCELGALRALRTSALSPSSILAISMCLLLFLGVLVAVTVWNQKGSRNKFRRRGVYHMPTQQESWEDVRENILNYNEEGGGEQDQNGYDMSELKRPVCSSLSQSSSCTTAPLLHSSPGSQEEVHYSAPYRPHRLHSVCGDLCSEPGPSPSQSQVWTRVYRRHVDFRSYVSRILWEADHQGAAFPPDSLHVWSVEGSGSSAGSLSSLGSGLSAGEEPGPGNPPLSH